MIGVLLAALLAGCVAHAPFISPRLSSSLPDELYFMRGGFDPNEYWLTKEGILVKSTFDAAYDQRRNYHWRTINEAGWRNFEQAVTPLHIRDWRSSYVPKNPPIDGMGWKFKWTDARQAISSSGVNAGPDARNPRKLVNAFGREVTGDELLERAFAQLWESSRPLVAWPTFKVRSTTRQ